MVVAMSSTRMEIVAKDGAGADENVVTDERVWWKKDAFADASAVADDGGTTDLGVRADGDGVAETDLGEDDGKVPDGTAFTEGYGRVDETGTGRIETEGDFGMGHREDS